MRSAAIDTREKILQAAQELVSERGLPATTVDAILDATGASKGAFFHHFPSKEALGRAVIDRYAQMDAAVLESYMTRAERLTPDPAQQLIEFLKGFEEDIRKGLVTQSGCLFASYVYQRIPDESGAAEVILGAIELWRSRILAKLQQAASANPPALPVDLESLADQVWTVFEGGFLLARATGDQMKLHDQLRHLRAYLTLLFGVEDGSG